MPGQTRLADRPSEHVVVASMEGRARARPNLHLRACLAASTARASMEGRARARPNPPVAASRAPIPDGFNGGPGTCPAKRELHKRTVRGAWELQWRAGHVPGQTTKAGVPTTEAMTLQWRAGHVPGQTTTSVSSMSTAFALQWRAGHVPGQTSMAHTDTRGGAMASMEGRARARPNVNAL